MGGIAEPEFGGLADLVRRRSGLLLTADKSELILRRLAPVARRFGFRNATALLAEIAHPPEELAQAVTEAMTTNETSFFRDGAIFDHFAASVLPPLLEARKAIRRLRIWCAGAATGQEAYSVAMILDEAGLEGAGFRVEVIATDLSAEAVVRAREGLYSQFEISRGLSLPRLDRHFARDGARWRVRERLRRMVTFRVFNLLDDFGWLGIHDVIFCRNVLLHFEHRACTTVFRKISEVLAPDGTLVLGTVESGAGSQFRPAAERRGIYVKPGKARRTAKLAL